MGATHVLHQGQPVAPRQSAWYTQQDPTFSDVLVFMRQTLWRRTPLFRMSPFLADSQKLPQRPPPQIMEVLCYTACMYKVELRPQLHCSEIHVSQAFTQGSFPQFARADFF